MPGFCLAFDMHIIKDKLKKNDRFKSDLYKRIYDKYEQEERMREIINNLLQEGIDGEMAQINTIQEVVSIAPILKNENFKEEEEWRLVITDVKDRSIVKERIGKSYFIPYIEINLRSNCDICMHKIKCESKDNICENHDWISEVMIGPCVNEDTAINSIILSCENNGLKLSTIASDNKKVLSTSDIPFRVY